MNRSVAFLGAAALAFCVSTAAFGYSATADVTFTWAAGGFSVGWTSNGANNYPSQPANTDQFFLQGSVNSDSSICPAAPWNGQCLNNSVTFYNPDFSIASDYGAGTADDCLTPTPPYESIVLRKYSCRQNDAEAYYAPQYNKAPVIDYGPGAAASGTLTVTDTTLKGTLTVISTTDEPTGATTTFAVATTGNPTTVRTSNSVGDGFDGYNIRTADGSPFGNAWYGITTSATLNVDLTGTFTDTAWTIDGGAVTFDDPGFACQQGGFGGDGRGTLCIPSATGGGFQANGGGLSWGMDVDGAGTAATVATPIVIMDGGGTTVLATISGVLAHLAIDGSGAITTTDGEFRYGLGAAAGGCVDHVRWGPRPPPETTNGFTCGTLSTGPLDVTGTVTTGVGGGPDPFPFTAVTNVPLSTTQTSNTVTLSGITAPLAITVSGDASSLYSINGAAFTAVAGTVNDGDTVAVQHTSSASNLTAVTTTLTIGSVSEDFTSTTLAGAGGPDPFPFTAVTDVPVSTTQTSNTVTLSGITAPLAITVSGDASSLYSINGAAFTAVAGTVNDGDTVAVQHTSSASNLTAVTTTLTVGTVSEDFTSTTVAAGGGGGPDPFTFTDVTGVPVSTTETSNTVTLAGITAPLAITVSGDASSLYSINGAAFTAVAGTVNDGDTVAVQHTSSASNSTAVTTTLTVGSVSADFTSTTEAAAGGGGGGLRADDGGSSLDALILALLGATALIRRRR